jgi:hypothetical protein
MYSTSYNGTQPTEILLTTKVAACLGGYAKSRRTHASEPTEWPSVVLRCFKILPFQVGENLDTSEETPKLLEASQRAANRHPNRAIFDSSILRLDERQCTKAIGAWRSKKVLNYIGREPFLKLFIESRTSFRYLHNERVPLA